MGLEDTLRTARLEQKRSVESVAGQIKVHPNTIRYAESGRTSIGVEIFQRWAAVLGYEVRLAPLSLSKRAAPNDIQEEAPV